MRNRPQNRPVIKFFYARNLSIIKHDIMKQNMGFIDKTIRILVALAILALYFTHVLSGTAALVLFVIAGIFVLTSFVGSCPIYHMLRWSTKQKKIES